jgi:hypothetical protein
MRFELTLFFLLFGAAMLGGVAEMIILHQMAARVLPTQLVLRHSAAKVLREFKTRYPGSGLPRARRIAIFIILFAGTGAMFVLFVLLPRYALPSR